MSRKNTILGLGALAAFGFASVSFAQCPSSTVPPWTEQDVGGGGAASIVTPGYDGTSCKLQVSLGSSGVTRAQVRDDTPAAEPRYRAQFLFDPSALSGASGVSQAVIHRANGVNVVNGNASLVAMRFAGSGGGTKRLLIAVACENGTTGVCAGSLNLPNQSGPNRIEYDLVSGADGAATFRYWVVDAGASIGDGTPTGTIAVTGGNAAYGGVDRAFLGLSGSSATYRSNNLNANAWFDEFDSRRSTFIGN